VWLDQVVLRRGARPARLHGVTSARDVARLWKERVEFSHDRRHVPCKLTPSPAFTVCFVAPTRASVAAFYAAALANGGRDNGPPGLTPRLRRDLLAAYVMDPDGYRIEAYCSGQ